MGRYAQRCRQNDKPGIQRAAHAALMAKAQGGSDEGCTFTGSRDGGEMHEAQALECKQDAQAQSDGAQKTTRQYSARVAIGQKQDDGTDAGNTSPGGGTKPSQSGGFERVMA